MGPQPQFHPFRAWSLETCACNAGAESDTVAMCTLWVSGKRCANMLHGSFPSLFSPAVCFTRRAHVLFGGAATSNERVHGAGPPPMWRETNARAQIAHTRREARARKLRRRSVDDHSDPTDSNTFSRAATPAAPLRGPPRGSGSPQTKCGGAPQTYA